MKYYISPLGQLFAYEFDGSQDHLIPTDFVPATQLQIDAIQNPPVDPKEAIKAQLAALDAANTLTQRNLRNTIQLMAEAFKQLSNGAVDLSAIPGVAKVYEVEAQAELLRGQL